MAFIITTEGKKVEIEPKNGKDFKWEEMKEIVDGYIEIVPSSQAGCVVVLNEEGLYREDLPWNPVAVEYLRPDVLCMGIRGNVLVCKSNQIR